MNRLIDIDEVSQEIDLSEFGLNISGNRVLKEGIAEALIQKMRDRVEKDGLGVGDSGKFVRLKAPYSDEYSDSLDFKAYGKSKNRVNMRLTGAMLDAIDVLDVDGDVVKIGIDDPVEAAKAFNHMVGDTVPRRPFFGLNKTEISEVLSRFERAGRAAERNDSRLVSLSVAAGSLLRRILNG